MKSLHTIFFTLLAIDLIGIGALWYGSIALQEEKQNEVVLRQELLGEELENDKAVALKRVLTSTEADRRALSQFIFQPSDEDQIKFITLIEHLGTSTTGAVVETISLNSSKPGVFSGDFSLKGTWPQIFHVIRLIEEFPARIVITKIDVKEEQNGQWAGVIKIDLLSLRSSKK